MQKKRKQNLHTDTQSQKNEMGYICILENKQEKLQNYFKTRN
jgi:hypothetical protein